VAGTYLAEHGHPCTASTWWLDAPGSTTGSLCPVLGRSCWGVWCSCEWWCAVETAEFAQECSDGVLFGPPITSLQQRSPHEP
jgi:hypothetical protein